MSDRPLIVALDDYEHALRGLADWSAVEARAPKFDSFRAVLPGSTESGAVESSTCGTPATVFTPSL